MSLRWTDILDIAIELDETHPEVDPLHVNFVDLRNWVLALPEFDDDPKHSGEKILEAIQMAWIDGGHDGFVGCCRFVIGQQDRYVCMAQYS